MTDDVPLLIGWNEDGSISLYCDCPECDERVRLFSGGGWSAEPASATECRECETALIPRVHAADGGDV